MLRDPAEARRKELDRRMWGDVGEGLCGVICGEGPQGSGGALRWAAVRLDEDSALSMRCLLCVCEYSKAAADHLDLCKCSYRRSLVCPNYGVPWHVYDVSSPRS